MGVEGTLSQVLMDGRRANRKCLEYSLEGMDRGNLRQAFSSWYDSCASGPKEIIVRVGGLNHVMPKSGKNWFFCRGNLQYESGDQCPPHTSNCYSVEEKN